METPHTTADNHAELTPAEQSLHTFFRLSYLHSQGDEGTQMELFLWAKKQGYLDTMVVPNPIPDYVYLGLRPPRVHKHVIGQPKQVFLPYRALIGAAHGALPRYNSGFDNDGENHEALFNSIKRRSSKALLYSILVKII
ncbi:MAG: hypothetical protein ACMG6E_03995, partial [Candidatus Roizmanbacteria bacterium]